MEPNQHGKVVLQSLKIPLGECDEDDEESSLLRAATSFPILVVSPTRLLVLLVCLSHAEPCRRLTHPAENHLLLPLITAH